MIYIAIKIKKRYQGRQREVNNDVINEMIKFPQLRVIVEHTKEQLGILSKDEALRKADEYELDLVLISDKATPPVAKIIDYGKYRYEKKKAEKQNQKNQRASETKEVRLSANIGVHDLEVKIKRASEFLTREDKVRLTLKLRGREMANKSIAEEKINIFLEKIQPFSKVEKDQRSANFYDILLAPIKK